MRENNDLGGGRRDRQGESIRPESFLFILSLSSFSSPCSFLTKEKDKEERIKRE
jgi:hypothetical protein